MFCEEWEWNVFVLVADYRLSSLDPLVVDFGQLVFFLVMKLCEKRLISP